MFLEYSCSNIYWIKNKLVAVKFSGLDCRRLFIHTVEKDNAGKYQSTGCYAVENSRSVLSQFFDALSVGEIYYSNCNEFTESKVLDNGRVVQFSNDICSVQVFNQSIDSVIISHKYNSGRNMKQFIVKNDLSGYFRDNVIKTTEWVMSSDFDAYWDFEELSNTQ